MREIERKFDNFYNQVRKPFHLAKHTKINLKGEILIEIVELDARTCIVCNEEGKLIGLAPNRRLGRDVLCGVFYVTGQDSHGNLASLSSAEIEKYKRVFAQPEIISAEEVEATLAAIFYAM